MNIVNHSKDLNSQQSLKKRYRYSIKTKRNFLLTILLASLIGTYLDLFFVGKGLYAFPLRPLPAIFTINILFTLIGLPLLMASFLYVCKKINRWQTAALILIVSVLMAVFEKLAEAYGIFVHHESWKHIYSFSGYSVFFLLIYIFYHWMEDPDRI